MQSFHPITANANKKRSEPANEVAASNEQSCAEMQ